MKDTAQLAAILKLASDMSPEELVRRMRNFGKQGRVILVKEGAIGGDQEAGFEQSFASLAYSYIQDKAPGMLDYMIGFQLVDRNEDNTKAVGVFGFKVGEQWMYVPVFFLSGDLKGHELLYLKNQDMFVPLKENWINYLINKKPQILGEGTNESVQQMGIMQPNVQGMILPPFVGKYSSAQIRPWAKRAELFKDMGRLSTDLVAAEHADAFFGGTSKVASAIDLGDLLRSDIRYLSPTISMCRMWPGVKAAMDVHYGVDFLEGIVEHFRKKAEGLLDEEESAPSPVLRKVNRGVPLNKYKFRKRKPGAVLKEAVADDPESPDVNKLELITENNPVMDEEEQQKLLRDGHLIRDSREEPDEFTQQYNTQVQMTLTNPDITGIYEVLTKPGDFEKCLVIFAPYGEDRRKRYVTVIRLGDSKAWKNIHPTKVYVRQGSTGPNQDGKLDWYEDLPGEENGAIRKGGIYVAVTPGGQGTSPFEASNKIDDDTYELYWKDYGSESPAYAHQDSSDGRICCGPSDTCYDRPTLVKNKRKGCKILLENKCLYLPEECKIIKIKDPPKCKECDKDCDECTCDYCHSPYEADPVIYPGEPKDLQMALRQKTSELKIVDDHCEVLINSQRMSKKAGLLHLVFRHGLSEKDAKAMLKEAEDLHGVRYRVKYAQGFPMGGMNQYPMMGGFPPPSSGGDGFAMGPYQMPEQFSSTDLPFTGAPVQEPFMSQQTIPGLEAGMTDPNIYNPMMVQDPMAQQVAQQAQQTGQKEVFDTAMLSSLTKVVHPENMVDKDLGNIAKTLNTLGRMLFMFYWHNEEFQDRYGKKDLPELEDTLRNAFEMLGDLLLYLKQKTVDTVFGTNLSNISPNIQGAARN